MGRGACALGRLDRELDEHERPLPKARAAWELVKRSINPFPPPGIGHSGLGNSGRAGKDAADGEAGGE